MRIVLDNNVLVRAAANPVGPAGALLPLITPPHLLLLSSYALRELAEVLHYNRIRRLHGLSDQQIGEFLQGIKTAALIVALHDPPRRIVPGDEDDAYLIATAIHGNANVICSRDRDLFDPNVLTYCHAHGIEVVDDLELLNRLRSTENT
jgi:putative PIN family toxin of toxin-antitoxin system